MQEEEGDLPQQGGDVGMSGWMNGAADGSCNSYIRYQCGCG